jgi:hypothetical protein
MKPLPFLILFGVNCLIYLALLSITCLILFRIKVKLNLATQLSFLSVLFALLMHILLSVYWYTEDNRDQTIFINCYIYLYQSFIVAFYIVNFGRVLVSWMLLSQNKLGQRFDV